MNGFVRIQVPVMHVLTIYFAGRTIDITGMILDEKTRYFSIVVPVDAIVMQDRQEFLATRFRKHVLLGKDENPLHYERMQGMLIPNAMLNPFDFEPRYLPWINIQLNLNTVNMLERNRTMLHLIGMAKDDGRNTIALPVAYDSIDTIRIAKT